VQSLGVDRLARPTSSVLRLRSRAPLEFMESRLLYELPANLPRSLRAVRTFCAGYIVRFALVCTTQRGSATDLDCGWTCGRRRARYCGGSWSAPALVSRRHQQLALRVLRWRRVLASALEAGLIRRPDSGPHHCGQSESHDSLCSCLEAGPPRRRVMGEPQCRPELECGRGSARPVDSRPGASAICPESIGCGNP